MLSAGDRILVAVSGGKDSLAVWDILLELGYQVDGLYLGLGIDGYCGRSVADARAFANDRDLSLEVVDLPADYGYDIPNGARAARRVPCSALGLHVPGLGPCSRGYVPSCAGRAPRLTPLPV